LNERKHLRHVCNQILHMVKIGGEKAWNHMCLGSDFDGLINPVNNCTSVAEYPKLEEGLLKMLPKMMKESDYTYEDSDVPQKVRAIMYDNALTFLE
jgi:microsomal dipeptidase-like Zn-dependent dipeptidase